MVSFCTHALPDDRVSRVRCKLDLHGGNPNISQCKRCPSRTPPHPANSPSLKARSNPVKSLKGSPPDHEFHANDRIDERIITSELTHKEIRIAESRAATCDDCEHRVRLRTWVKSWPVFHVRCELCGCSGLDLVHGQCPDSRWQPHDHDNGKNTPNPEINDRDRRDPHAKKTPSKQVYPNKQKLLLRCKLSPGDVIMLTAAVRDLHRARPNRYAIAVDTTAPDIWKYNPNIADLPGDDDGIRTIDMHYPLINCSNQRPAHFIRGYTAYLERQLEIDIPTTEFRGDIHLADDETGWMNQVEEQFGYRGPFWVLVAGGKYDFTAKWWSPKYAQRLVDHFHGRLQFVQCGASDHWHPPLKRVFNLVGKTDLRQFIRLIYHAQGVVCPVTLAMHLAAAVPTKSQRLRPCVVLAGGREPPHWEAYPGHQFLHTIGMLPCCASGGCWRSRCHLVGDGDAKDQTNTCDRPVQVTDDLRIPQCMTMISPERVIDSIEQYLHYW